ncbi:MAG: A24 family peptidase [Planctomycetia bacterium]|nr:A24 family peptidase [Planctomycetia bacterium]
MSQASIATLVAADGLPAGLLVAIAGIAAGRLLTAAVGQLVEPLPRGRRLLDGMVVVAVAAATLATWWWEVRMRGQLPVGIGLPTANDGLALGVRWAGHVVLLVLLAAATWVDLRHRVIPDLITVPGVLGGMLVAALWPDVLLPIAREVPRSFAPPLLEADVLGAFGGLRDMWPTWLDPASSASGLFVAAAIFAAWWLVGTEPSVVATEAMPWWRRALVEPRNLVAVVGAGIIGNAWIAGGLHWRGLVSSLVGLAVAAGIIWLTRAGASRALGREAMGLGDVTLMAMVGVWLGWQPCVLVCFLAVFIGLAHGIVQIVTRSETELPFGPSLCLGSAVVVVWWRPLWEQTAVFFDRPQELAIVVGTVIGLTAITLWGWHQIRPIQAG